jgi:replicative DNA helicase
VTNCARGIIRHALAGDRQTSNLLSLLWPSWISDEKARAVIETIIDLSITGRPITHETISMRLSGVVGKKLARDLFYSKKGVVQFLEEIEDEAIPEAGIPALAEQIKLESTIATIKASAKEMVSSLDSYVTAEEASTKSIEIMAAAIDESIGDDESVEAGPLVQDWFAKRMDRSKEWSVDWPFQTWNKYAPLRAKQIAVYAAPTGVGKSWFGTGMVEEGCKAGGRVAVFTGEMSAQELLERMVKGGGFSDADMEQETPSDRLMKRAEEVSEWDFVIHEGPITIDRIRAACVRARAVGKPYSLVIVDHVHLMRFGAGNYRLELNDAMSAFKSEIAQREGCAVILLCQLRRPHDGKQRKRPRKEDIKESSAIEQIADFVFLMAQQNEDDVDSTRANVWCDKRRGGRRFPVIEVEIHEKLNRLIEQTGYPIRPTSAATSTPAEQPVLE